MSMNLSDLYGAVSASTATLQPTSVGGPNQGAVAPPSEHAPMAATGSGSGAAFSWLGLVLLLLIWRLLLKVS